MTKKPMTQAQYLKLISREPTADMIENGKGYRYIKKSVLKMELLNIYGGHTKFEMIESTVSKNGLWGSGLLHYQHPVSKEWLFESGMASVPHTKKMQLNYPTLKSQVFKNACREIGVWFGQTLNVDIEDQEPEEDTPVINVADERMIILIEKSTTVEELAAYKAKLNETTRATYMEKLKQLTQKIKP